MFYCSSKSIKALQNRSLIDFERRRLKKLTTFRLENAPTIADLDDFMKLQHFSWGTPHKNVQKIMKSYRSASVAAFFCDFIKNAPTLADLYDFIIFCTFLWGLPHKKILKFHEIVKRGQDPRASAHFRDQIPSNWRANSNTGTSLQKTRKFYCLISSWKISLRLI